MIPIISLLLLQSGSVGPARTPDVPGVVTAARVAPASRPVLDGRLDDAAWTLATPIGGLMQRDPQEGAAATEQVDVRILYDAEAFTTVSSWSTTDWLKVTENGKIVLRENTKRVAFLQFESLPRHTSQRLELALYLLDRDPEGERRLKQAEKDAADRAHLESHGWRVRDSREVAGSPEAYRAYVQQSRGEFSCAKPSCMEFQNAWVSDRTLCYLASGKPVVVQHTGPSSYLPHGEGMFRFTSLPEAVEALESIASDYARHCRAARDIAETQFDAWRVLETALNAALSTQPAALQRAGA